MIVVLFKDDLKILGNAEYSNINHIPKEYKYLEVTKEDLDYELELYEEINEIKYRRLGLKEVEIQPTLKEILDEIKTLQNSSIK